MEFFHTFINVKFLIVPIYILFKIFRKFIILGPYVENLPDLTAKTIIITGERNINLNLGSSSGIGQSTAEILAKQGATIIFACRNEKKTKKVIHQIQSKLEGISKENQLHFIEIDLSNFKSIELFHQHFDQKFGRLDILINNAAVISRVEKKTNDNARIRTSIRNQSLRTSSINESEFISFLMMNLVYDSLSHQI
jgi:NAD(P)-dependent dehydrogenase (short-subunit alcohol dehydrogenase family)